MKRTDLSLTESVYTHVCSVTGKNTNIATDRLRIWCLSEHRQLTTIQLPIDPHLARQWVRDNVVNCIRVGHLQARHLIEPIIVCKTGEIFDNHIQCLFVDGHHRYVRAALEKRPSITAWLLDPLQWHLFEIEDLEAVNDAQLKAIPTFQFHHND